MTEQTATVRLRAQASTEFAMRALLGLLRDRLGRKRDSLNILLCIYSRATLSINVAAGIRMFDRADCRRPLARA